MLIAHTLHLFSYALVAVILQTASTIQNESFSNVALFSDCFKVFSTRAIIIFKNTRRHKFTLLSPLFTLVRNLFQLFCHSVVSFKSLLLRFPRIYTTVGIGFLSLCILSTSFASIRFSIFFFHSFFALVYCYVSFSFVWFVHIS